jgi:hypothetical protein
MAAIDAKDHKKQRHSKTYHAGDVLRRVLVGSVRREECHLRQPFLIIAVRLVDRIADHNAFDRLHILCRFCTVVFVACSVVDWRADDVDQLLWKGVTLVSRHTSGRRHCLGRRLVMVKGQTERELAGRARASSCPACASQERRTSSFGQCDRVGPTRTREDSGGPGLSGQAKERWGV